MARRAPLGQKPVLSDMVVSCALLDPLEVPTVAARLLPSSVRRVSGTAFIGNPYPLLSLRIILPETNTLSTFRTG